MPEVITDNLDLWSSALLTRSTAGRGNNSKLEAYGIKKLRGLILELAVRGKLVPQDANDEPASLLLKKIEEKTKRLMVEGKIRKSNPPPQITHEDMPYELPKSWVWARLGNIGVIGSSSRVHQKDWKDSGVPFYRAREIVQLSKYGIVDNELFITEEHFQSLASSGTAPEPGDVMLTGVGTIGVPYVVRASDRFYFKDASVLIFKNYFKVFPLFLRYLFESQYWINEIHKGSMGTTVHTLTISRANEVLTPLPPVSEQQRIVAKVDELMALCDQLEQQQTHSLAAHQSLVASLLGTLTRVESQQEFSEAWTRIASHFDTLFTTEASIDQLKQTILQLAVMGKLVPQDPNDEPASVLLHRIAAEKVRLIYEGKISKPKPLPPVAEEEKPFDIPDGWKWTRFDDLALHSEAGWSPSCEPTPRQGDSWGVLKVSAVTWGKYDPHENKALPANLEPKPEFEVMPCDFLISRSNTAELVARAVVVPNGAPPRLMMSDKIIRFVFTPELDHEYLRLVNGSELSRAYYARVAGGTSSSMKNVSREQIRNLVVALPPLAEQHRIVAKVDELMALCDTLKARLADAQAIQLHLADAIVEQALV